MPNDPLNQPLPDDGASPGTPAPAMLRAASSGAAVTGAGDPRLERGAYLTDGIDLYEVMSVLRAPGVLGFSTARVIVEDCRSLSTIELLPETIRRSFRLVREAPIAARPDLGDGIAR